MFTITDKQDMDALNKYNAEIKLNCLYCFSCKWITN